MQMLTIEYSTCFRYGDFHPTTSSTKWFCIFFIPLCVTLMSVGIGRIANMFVSAEIEKNFSKKFRREFTLAELKSMDQNGDDEIDKLEFVEHFLLSMQKVDKALLKQLHDQFNALDADGNRKLTKEDFDLLDEKKLRGILGGDSKHTAHTNVGQQLRDAPGVRSIPPGNEHCLDAFPVPDPQCALISAQQLMTGQLLDEDIISV
jgi:hypothetical protein